MAVYPNVLIQSIHLNVNPLASHSKRSPSLFLLIKWYTVLSYASTNKATGKTASVVGTPRAPQILPVKSVFFPPSSSLINLLLIKFQPNSPIKTFRKRVNNLPPREILGDNKGSSSVKNHLVFRKFYKIITLSTNMKKWIIIILLVLIIAFLSFFGLNLYVNSQLKETYTGIYQSTCDFTKNVEDPLDVMSEEFIPIVRLCQETGGCFEDCGGSCAKPQKLFLFDTFDYFGLGDCVSTCEQVCYCPYGQEFIEGIGCSDS